MGKRQVCTFAGEQAGGARPLGDIVRVGGLELLHAPRVAMYFAYFPAFSPGFIYLNLVMSFGTLSPP